MRKLLVLAALALVAGLMVFAGGQATAGPSCDRTVSDGESIQAAINAASSGETICVKTGSYAGFDANVDGITVRAKSKPVINGAGISYGGQVVGILVTADDVTIQGFKVTGAYSTGIWAVIGADRAQILKNTVDQTGFDPGALAGWDGSAVQSHGADTLISKNKVEFGASSRPHNGINVFDNDHTIQKNKVNIFEAPKYQVGINVHAPGSATVEDNKVTSPDKTVGSWTRVFGIWFYGATGTIEANRVSKTDYAVWLAKDVVTTGNVASATVEENHLDNDGIGVVLEGGSFVRMNDNKIKHSWWLDVYVGP